MPCLHLCQVYALVMNLIWHLRVVFKTKIQVTLKSYIDYRVSAHILVDCHKWGWCVWIPLLLSRHISGTYTKIGLPMSHSAIPVRPQQPINIYKAPPPRQFLARTLITVPSPLLDFTDKIFVLIISILKFGQKMHGCWISNHVWTQLKYLTAPKKPKNVMHMFMLGITYFLSSQWGT